MALNRTTDVSPTAQDREERCPHGDSTCPCPDGDWCHYEAVEGHSPASVCVSPDCIVTTPHQRASL